METLLELLGYVLFFWLFLLSPSFRAAQIQEWREGGVLARMNLVYEAVFSVLFGVVLPVTVIVLMLEHAV